MARPNKQGIPYFPLDVDFREDDKVALIAGENKEKGFEILVTLLMKIYKEGYYYQWTEKEEILFCNRYSFLITSVQNVVSSSLKWGFFHLKLKNSYHILTSSGIQKRWLVATKKRSKVFMYKEFCLIDDPKELNSKVEIVSGGENLIYSSINFEKVGINTQSKVKYSKVKYISDPTPAESNKKTNPEKKHSSEEIKLYNEVLEDFTKAYGDNFPNYAKEGTHIYSLIARANKLFPCEEREFIRDLIRTLSKLKKTQKDFWKDQPLLPSTINSDSIYPRILEHMKTARSDPELLKLIDEVIPSKGLS